METLAYVPCTKCDAALILRLSFAEPVQDLSREDFINVWHSIFYLFPGIHPDGYDASDSSWPRVLKPFADEAWRRFENGELHDEELYPADATWSCIFDHMTRPHTIEEAERRANLAALHGLPL
jgi:hypothetical protein